VSAPGAKGVDLTIGSTKVEGWDTRKWQAALNAAGYPAKADLSQGQLVHGRTDPGHHGDLRDHGVRPDRAFLVEMFPTNIRYTSMSLPYHIGNGWFGGMLPLLATAVVARPEYLRRPLVPHRGGGDDLDRGIACSCATPRASISPPAPAWRSRRPEPYITARRRGVERPAFFPCRA
jgi:hypothetical protein